MITYAAFLLSDMEDRKSGSWLVWLLLVMAIAGVVTITAMIYAHPPAERGRETLG
jgi:hypothetical protein